MWRILNVLILKEEQFDHEQFISQFSRTNEVNLVANSNPNAGLTLSFDKLSAHLASKTMDIEPITLHNDKLAFERFNLVHSKG